MYNQAFYLDVFMSNDMDCFYWDPCCFHTRNQNYKIWNKSTC